MRLPAGQKPKHERVANPLQKKPEFSMLKAPKPPLDYGEWRESPQLAEYYRALPILKIESMNRLFEAMYMYNCTLRTNYTSIWYCQNDGYVTEKSPKGLHLPIEGATLQKILCAEFLEARPRLSVFPNWFENSRGLVFHLEKVGSNLANYVDTYKLVIEGE